MDIGEIQRAIEGLSPERQMTLLDWLAERAGGSGMSRSNAISPPAATVCTFSVG
ncbi:MAG: hypothetical protein ABSH56_29015 [Bryobacteraceae bacterium]|jgi:hypothetical protein